MNPIKRPALRYFGGKWAIGKWVISHFPPHTAYCEPFGGGASVLLRKEPSKIETYNDLNGMAVTFFQVLRDQPEELIRRLKLTPYSRAEYLASQKSTPEAVEQARRFYVWCWQGRGRGGVQEAGGWRFMRSDSRGQTPCDDWRKVEYLYDVAERLRNVQIEHVDALRCLELYDTPATLFYVDPPYVPETRSLRWGSSAYVHDYSNADHRRLAEALHQVKGMVILSGYPSALYAELYGDWEQSERTAYKDTQAARRMKTTEVLWLNPAVRQGMKHTQGKWEFENGKLELGISKLKFEN